MKNFTKLVTVLLSLVLVFSVVGCGSSEEKNTEAKEQDGVSIDSLMTEDYLYSTMGPSEDDPTWKGVFLKAEDYSAAYRVVINFTEDEQKAYNAVDFAEEGADEKWREIVKGAKDIAITDISDRIPSQEELDAEYVGKTIGDLEEAGFDNSGQTNDEEGHYKFFYDGPEYCIEVAPAIVIEDIDDYSPNDIRALEIATVEFCGFSDAVLE